MVKTGNGFQQYFGRILNWKSGRSSLDIRDAISSLFSIPEEASFLPVVLSPTLKAAAHDLRQNHLLTGLLRLTN